jgi:hypothetical protein
MRRPVSIALTSAIAAALAFPAAASALIVYELLAVPLTATAGQQTAFSMTLTNLLGPDELGCLEVDLPGSFEVHSVSDPVGPSGRDWSAEVDGNTVVVWSESGGGRLGLLQSASFTINATPTVAGATAWSNHTHRDQDCEGSNQVGLPVSVTVLPPLLPTPTPVPTPVPTPTPTPSPTPTPTAAPTPAVIPTLPPLPLPLPTARPPAATPRPAAGASPAETLAPTPAPSAAARPAPDAIPASDVNLGGPGAPGDPGLPGPVVNPPIIQVVFEGGGPFGTDGVAVLASDAVFAVPAALLGGPGLLLILWVALQTLGAATWIPAVRRLRGKDHRPA